MFKSSKATALVTRCYIPKSHETCFGHFLRKMSVQIASLKEPTGATEPSKWNRPIKRVAEVINLVKSGKNGPLLRHHRPAAIGMGKVSERPPEVETSSSGQEERTHKRTKRTWNEKKTLRKIWVNHSMQWKGPKRVLTRISA